MNPIVFTIAIALLARVSASGHSIRGKPRYLSPLIGTSWTAVEIVFNEESITQQRNEVLSDHPITLSFDSVGTRTRAAGSTGCNRYFGMLKELSQNSFTTPRRFATTRKYCRGVMVQEMNYMRFLGNKKFYYKVVSAGDNEDELILLDNEENILARFHELGDDGK
mmetsp:Transcript_12177/g.21886  ORF Transcript_12177/g.21886 Transcript_12177/m.21886 type:complete len:165 (+) Transcript_12177:64-558(+)